MHHTDTITSAPSRHVKVEPSRSEAVLSPASAGEGCVFTSTSWGPSGPGTSQLVALSLEPDRRRAPTSRGQQPPGPPPQRRGHSLQPTSGENVWNSVSALGSGQWFFFFFFSYPSLPNQLIFPRPLGQFGDNCPGSNRRYDHGLFASEVTVLSEIPDAQISVLQKERRLFPGETWRNFGKKEKGERR